jgi:ubiquinone/menaquinone biosynthesis C-methylase UbiE
MTDFEKIKGYYSVFNEEARLERDASGKLEFEMTMRKLQKYLPASATILDLGGAAGAYTFPLAECGYQMYLADLSETLIANAREKSISKRNENVISCDVVNAIDLSIYEDEQFDVVLLFGPLYHLLEAEERNQCIKEVHRVLKNGGLVFASFIPYLSGSIAIVDRYCWDPGQVNKDTLREVFHSGKFVNAANRGFQEGYYPSSEEIAQLFSDNQFTQLEISSIRGFGYEREEKLYALKDEEMFKEIIGLIEQTSGQKELVETCGHAMYIGVKK